VHAKRQLLSGLRHSEKEVCARCERWFHADEEMGTWCPWCWEEVLFIDKLVLDRVRRLKRETDAVLLRLRSKSMRPRQALRPSRDTNRSRFSESRMNLCRRLFDKSRSKGA
jgi:hypothetical protein